MKKIVLCQVVITVCYLVVSILWGNLGRPPVFFERYTDFYLPAYLIMLILAPAACWTRSQELLNEWHVCGWFSTLAPLLAACFGGVVAVTQLVLLPIIILVTGSLVSLLVSAWIYAGRAGLSRWKLMATTLAQALLVFAPAFLRALIVWARS